MIIANQGFSTLPTNQEIDRARRRTHSPIVIGEEGTKKDRESEIIRDLVKTRSIWLERSRTLGIGVKIILWPATSNQIMTPISRCKGKERFILHRRSVSIKLPLQSLCGV